MYFPPYESVLNSIGLNKDDAASSNYVKVPADFLRFLWQAALSTSHFDEENYLRSNPDVHDAVKRGDVVNGKQHFVGFGYFEGRQGYLPKVDASWYLQTYPDVRDAISKGQIGSASKHFEIVGASEGRAPAPEFRDVAAFWKKTLVRSK